MLTEPRATYKPIQYPWAHEYYKKQHKAHWMFEEVPMAQDISDYNTKLSPGNRNMIGQVFRFFTTADVDVADGYSTHYMPYFKAPEIRQMHSIFAAMEGIHIEAYSLLLETLGFHDSEMSKFLDIKAMRDKHEYLANYNMSTPHEVAKTIAMYSGFTEGVQLFGSFAILLNFSRFNLMKGMGQIIAWSIRDESLHVEGNSMLFRTFISENPGIWNDKLKYEIYCGAERAVELEDAFIDVCYEGSDIPDLPKEQVKLFIRYLADRRLLGLGLKKIFNSGDRNPLSWFDALTNGLEHANFFETRSTEYTKASTTGNLQDIFK